MAKIGDPSGEAGKFRANLGRNLVGVVVLTLLFLLMEVLGIWDAVEGDIISPDGNGTVGYVLALSGLFVPAALAKAVLRWDGEQVKDFVAFLYGLLFCLIIVALYLLVQEVPIFLSLNLWASGLLLVIGVLLLAGSWLLSEKEKFRFGTFSIFMGDILVVLSVLSILGGVMI